MDSKTRIMTLGMLRKQLSKFKVLADVSDDTKIFLDIGWGSIQEVASDALEAAQTRGFTVGDELIKESFSGYAQEEKAEWFGTSK